LFIALSLINKPEVVILDELTTGLDPQARRATWELVRAIRDGGTTVILVTHFMEEAELLADRVAMIDHGRVIALDTPDQLIADLGGGTRVRFTAQKGFDPQTLSSISEVSRVESNGSDVTVYGEGALMARVAGALADQNIVTSDLRTERATLEDVFIKLANGDSSSTR
jgi:ABC-2 type transport system ATP-binding protein